MQQSQRQAAALVAAVEGGSSLTEALSRADLRDAGPARALVHELAYGTLRHLGRLDAIVRRLAAKPVADREVALLLDVALYQLVHTRAPDFAVVDQAVEAVAAGGRPQARSLVNALLRRYLRERASIDAALERSDDARARWSYPGWWVARLARDHPANWQSLLAAGNERPPLTLRANLRAIGRDALLARFAAEGVAAQAGGDAAIVVDAPVAVTALPGFAEGLFSVQDAGAQLAAALLDARDGLRVLDAWAAPGGKSTHILERADVTLLALDRDEARLSRVRDNLARLSLAGPRVTVAAGDAATPSAWWDGSPFDRILADVPCSASGIVRRHPDAKWLRRESDIARFAATQDTLLDALWTVLAHGGAMLYATCSVFDEENEARVAAFCARTPGALRETLNFPAGVAHDGGQVLPSSAAPPHNRDGFFYARIRKA